MRRAYVFCVIGIVAVSFAASFIRIADAHPTVIAFMRMAIASVLLAIVWLATNREYPLTSDIPYLIAAGVCLALHFVTWIASFGMTSVASSVVLVTMQPLFVLAIYTFLFREKITSREILGVALCLAGALSIAWSDMQTGGHNTLYGNVLALSGAAFAALYFVFGKRVRQRLHILPYVSITYSIAAITLGLIVLVYRLPMGPFSWPTWGAFVGLALICTVIGHSSFNYAIAYLPASTVSVATLGEPIGATLLAAVLLREAPTLGQILGGAVIIIGIYVFSAKPQSDISSPNT
ncbi:MAG: EamA family transporter [Bacillota bacterium]|nr:EamA family transporter [Bacillota bacterium]